VIEFNCLKSVLLFREAPWPVVMNGHCIFVLPMGLFFKCIGQFSDRVLFYCPSFIHPVCFSLIS